MVLDDRWNCILGKWSCAPYTCGSHHSWINHAERRRWVQKLITLKADANLFCCENRCRYQWKGAAGPALRSIRAGCHLEWRKERGRCDDASLRGRSSWQHDSVLVEWPTVIYSARVWNLLEQLVWGLPVTDTLALTPVVIAAYRTYNISDIWSLLFNDRQPHVSIAFDFIPNFSLWRQPEPRCPIGSSSSNPCVAHLLLLTSVSLTQVEDRVRPKSGIERAQVNIQMLRML